MYYASESILDNLILIIFFLISIILWEFYRAQDYEINGKKIIIVKRIKSIIIRFDEIESVEEIKRKFYFMLFGNTFSIGIGYNGLYWIPGVGIIHYYLTSWKNKLLIRLINKKKYMISPDDDLRDEIVKLFSK
ncbi:MAG: PH domain-containing protein [FCB group bacterium]|jgi:hypothetical protein